jgi:hypothetical protein
MKRILVGTCLLLILAMPSIVAAKDPVIQMVDGKLTIQAESVTLKQFLQALDAATGMNSKVSPQLANEKISVRLTGVDLNTAIRKSFQGQPWNYVVAVGKGISIIDKAQIVAATGTGTSPVQTFSNDIRNDIPPPLPNAAAFSQTGPVPVPASPSSPNPSSPNPSSPNPNQPAVLNLPPAQGGTAAPAPLFQAPGTTLGAPLPGIQQGK